MRGGKGDKDRYVMLSERLSALERYWRQALPSFCEGVKRGPQTVYPEL